MSIKDKIKQRQIAEKTKIDSLKNKVVSTDETESVEYLHNYTKLKKLFYPDIDYSDATNFSRYGNPRDVYQKSISKIYEMYPYDGSLSSKIEWEIENSYLERHIFENEYPRKVGYITISSDSNVVPNDASKNRDHYFCPQVSAIEYIEFKGGPHTLSSGAVAKNDAEIVKSYSSTKEKVEGSNQLRYSKISREFDEMYLSNLYASGPLGNTVEFWLNRKDRPSAQDQRYIVFDMHNFKEMSSNDYGRFRIEYSQDSSINGGRPLFYVTYLAPDANGSPSRVTSGVLDCVLGENYEYSTSEFFDDWHHVAISVMNSGSNLKVYLYVDGNLADTKTALGQAVGVMPAPHEALIGAMASQHELDQVPVFITTSENGNDLDVDISFEAGHGPGNYENIITPSGTRDDDEGLLNDARTGLRQVQDSTAVYISMRRVLTYPHGIGNMEISPEYKGFQQSLDMTVPNFAPAGTVFYGIRVYIKNSINQVIRSYLIESGENYREIEEDSVLCEKGHAKFPGSIDDFRFWKSRRSQRQVSKWFQQTVGGNADHAEENKTLGVYYKFNEGIHGLEGYDRVIIDYSGKKNNATWYGKPAGLGRTEESAIESFNNLKKEFRDPVLYDTHPEVLELQSQKDTIASSITDTRSSQLWRHLPDYVVESNNILQQETSSDLRNMLSIMGSYLDELWMQIKVIGDIKNNKYDSYDKTPAPFLKTMLEHSGLNSGDIFINSSVHELLHGQNSEVTFERDITEVKNLIYQNIYSNLSYIYKSKGTMEGFYSLMRCFGIDEQIVKVNLYANNTEYEFEDDYKMASLQRPYINFYDDDNKSGVIYQAVNQSSPEMSPPGYSLNHIPSLVSSQTQRATHSLSSEVEVFLPKGSNQATPTSIYGCYAADNQGVLYSTQQEKDSTGDYFVTVQGESSALQSGGKFTLNLRLGSTTYQLDSPILEDLQEDCKWNISVVIRSAAAGYESDLNASLDESPIVVDFIGFNTESSLVRSQFLVSREFYPTAHGQNNEMYSDAILVLKSNLRFFMGARYFESGYPTFDITKNLTHQCVANAGTLRVWCAPLSQQEMEQHALKPLNYGVDNPSFNVMSVEFDLSTEDDKVEICKSETLMLDWRFDNLRATDGNGSFWVDDFSPGRPSINNPLSTLDKINTFYAAYGAGFAALDSTIVDNRFIFAGKLCLPESISSDNTIRILTTDETAFTKNSRPKRMFLSVEKSMYQNISQEMMNIMHSITEFSSLVGAPVNKYRSEYKDLRKLRELFFKNIENTPDLERYLQFYKWIDGALSEMLMQLMPATVNQLSNTGVRDIVEPHVFERNKYQHKFPELISLGEPPETVIRGHAELNYNWRLGHAPIELQTGGDHDKNHIWWSERVERDSVPGSANGTSVEDIDIVREEIREAIIYQTTNDLPDKVKLRNNINLDQTSKDVPKLVSSSGSKYEASPYFSRRLNKHSKLSVDQYRTISGGSNFFGNKKKQIYKAITSNIDSSDKLVFDFDYLIDSPKQDEQNILGKRLLHTLGHDTTLDFDAMDGDSARLAPFSIYEIKDAVYDGTRLMEYDDVSYLSRLGYASSLDSLRQEKNLEITNLHGDSYLDSGEVPMQGPFTQRHIGGNQHRHVPVFTPRLTQSSIAEFAYIQRPEAFDLGINSKKIELSPIALNSFEISSPAVLTIDIALANNATTGQYTQLTLNGQTAGGETIFRPIFGSQHGANTDYVDVFIGHRFVEDSYTLKHLVLDKYVLRLTSDINNSAAVPAEALASLEQIASNFVSIPDQTLQIIQNRSTEELFPHRIIRGLATLMREEHAKRPLNIKNIKSSDLAPGNFKNQYEIISVGPRSLNNRDFIKNTQNYEDLEDLSLFSRQVVSDARSYSRPGQSPLLDPNPPTNEERLKTPAEKYLFTEPPSLSSYSFAHQFSMLGMYSEMLDLPAPVDRHTGPYNLSSDSYRAAYPLLRVIDSNDPNSSLGFLRHKTLPVDIGLAAGDYPILEEYKLNFLDSGAAAPSSSAASVILENFTQNSEDSNDVMHDLVFAANNPFTHDLDAETTESTVAISFVPDPNAAPPATANGGTDPLNPALWSFQGSSDRFIQIDEGNTGSLDPAVLLLGAHTVNAAEVSHTLVQDAPIASQYYQVAEYVPTFSPAQDIQDRAVYISVDFDIAAVQTAANTGVLRNEYSLTNPPNAAGDDVWVQYELDSNPGVWNDIVHIPATDLIMVGTYADWTSKTGKVEIPFGSTASIRIINHITGPAGSDQWGIRNLVVDVIVESPVERHYNAFEFNTPFVRSQHFPENKVDVSFDLQISRYLGGLGNATENIYFVVAKRLANNRAEPISFHNLDFANLLKVPGLDLTANPLDVEHARYIQDLNQSNYINNISISDIDIPDGDEIVFYFVRERDVHTADTFMFYFSNILIKHATASPDESYTTLEIDAVTRRHLLHTQFEKEIINRNPSGDHVIVERFSSPGSIYTMGVGSLDRLSGQYSPYNALSFRNRKLSNILNIEASKVYNGPYDSSIPEHKVHRNVERKIINKNVASPLESSGWVFSAGADIIDV